MADEVERIAVVQGAQGALVQDLFRTLATRWQASARLAGVVAEDHGLPDRACSAGYLRNLRDGVMFPIFQDLGPGSKACHLEGTDALAAAAAVRRDISHGCDLVVLSKFGKLEAQGGGLRDAFTAAFEARVPVLTSVSPPFRDAWERFAAPLFVVMPAEIGRIDAWWQAVRSGQPTVSAASEET
jgi:hypothetical protein